MYEKWKVSEKDLKVKDQIDYKFRFEKVWGLNKKSEIQLLNNSLDLSFRNRFKEELTKTLNKEKGLFKYMEKESLKPNPDLSFLIACMELINAFTSLRLFCHDLLTQDDVLRSSLHSQWDEFKKDLDRFYIIEAQLREEILKLQACLDYEMTKYKIGEKGVLAR